MCVCVCVCECVCVCVCVHVCACVCVMSDALWWPCTSVHVLHVCTFVCANCASAFVVFAPHKRFIYPPICVSCTIDVCVCVCVCVCVLVHSVLCCDASVQEAIVRSDNTSLLFWPKVFGLANETTYR